MVGTWRETAIAITAFASWFALALLLEMITGYDGVRLTAYGLLAAGLGLMAWSWWRAPRHNTLAIGFLLALGSLTAIFGKY